MDEQENGILFVVGTPIGNLSDVSSRCLSTLESVDFIAAEDTRVSLKLLNHFEIKKPLISYFEHNKATHGPQILDKISSGQTCALITDAGMPAISDPGEDLVREALERGIKVVAVPGPCAVTTALAISGMPSGRFCFEGFLSTNKASRKEHLNEIKDETRTIIFYEAPHKLQSTLVDLFYALGDRKIALIKELTKIYEKATITTLAQAVELYTDTPPKGEFVLVIEGKNKPEKKEFTLDEAVFIANNLLKDGISSSMAAKMAAKDTNIKKNDIYRVITTKQ